MHTVREQAWTTGPHEFPTTAHAMLLSVRAAGITVERDTLGIVTKRYAHSRPSRLDVKGHMAALKAVQERLVKNPTHALEVEWARTLEDLSFATAVLKNARAAGMLRSPYRCAPPPREIVLTTRKTQL